MRVECGQVTELMKNRFTVNTALLFYTCLHMSGDHIVIIGTSLRIHKGLDDVLSMNFKGNWKLTVSIHRKICLQEKGKKAQDDKTFQMITMFS